MTDQLTLPPGARPARPHPGKEKPPKAERHVGGVIAELAARYQTSQPPELELDGPVLRAHQDIHPGHACPGGLRELDRDELVVTLRCDTCGFETTFKPEVVDRDLRVAAILRRARLPERFVDEPLPPHDGTRLARGLIGELLERWGDEDRPRPPFLHGPFGRGKSHLLTRTSRMLIERHEVRLRYCTMGMLLDEAKAAMDAKGRDPKAETVTEVFDRAAHVDVLVLDDLKALSSDWQQERLEQLVDLRYQDRLPIMGATNVPVNGWQRAFGPRVASRLYELTNPVAITGPDWRQS